MSKDDSVAKRLSAAGIAGAGLAHELRNALAVAETGLFLLRRDLGSIDTSVEGRLSQVESEVRKSQAMVDSVLCLVRGETPRVDRVRIQDLCDVALSAVRLPEGIASEVRLEPDDLVIDCEPILMERVLVNLYLNARQALGARSGTIRTIARRDDGDVEIVVSDSGPGFGEREPASLFRPLASDRIGGTGLGLPFCKVVVEAHRGTLAAAREGEWTSFILRVPSDDSSTPSTIP